MTEKAHRPLPVAWHEIETIVKNLKMCFLHWAFINDEIQCTYQKKNKRIKKFKKVKTSSKLLFDINHLMSNCIRHRKRTLGFFAYLYM